MKTFRYVIGTPWRDIPGTIEAVDENEAQGIAECFARGFTYGGRVKLLELVEADPDEIEAKAVKIARKLYRLLDANNQTADNWKFCKAVAVEILKAKENE